MQPYKWVLKLESICVFSVSPPVQSTSAVLWLIEVNRHLCMFPNSLEFIQNQTIMHFILLEWIQETTYGRQRRDWSLVKLIRKMWDVKFKIGNSLFFKSYTSWPKMFHLLKLFMKENPLGQTLELYQLGHYKGNRGTKTIVSIDQMATAPRHFIKRTSRRN